MPMIILSKLSNLRKQAAPKLVASEVFIDVQSLRIIEIIV